MNINGKIKYASAILVVRRDNQGHTTYSEETQNREGMYSRLFATWHENIISKWQHMLPFRSQS